MKKLILVFCALQCIFLSSCWHHDRHISIRYNDKAGSYSMDAWFSKNKTRAAERYMNEMIGQDNNISFFNTESDGVFTLDDGSKFYMKKSAGHIMIKIDKDENSHQAFHTLKHMCEGMKEVVLR